ncbi:histone deacetylase family protein [Paracoccaceae bacterium GXU_MW_L88]
MRGYLDQRQSLHEPVNALNYGAFHPCRENPKRIEALEAGAKAAGLKIISPEDAGIAPIAAIHQAEYLYFLQNIYTRWREIPGTSPQAVPNTHPQRAVSSYPAGAVGQLGWHMYDASCPIGPESWNAAYWSAQSAIAAADDVLENGGGAYALCRPPGHHAFADQGGGFCFLANSAIAAQRAREAGARVAILDIDVHHGNGTQGIFWERGDVLTLSIHLDPDDFYPYFWGHSHERGGGAGEGANLNLPLQRKADDAAFLDALDRAMAQIEMFGTEFLVIAAGLDAFIGDPFAALGVTTEGFARIGERIGKAGLDTVIVQEGGYLCPELGDNLTALLTGFRSGSGV